MKKTIIGVTLLFLLVIGCQKKSTMIVESDNNLRTIDLVEGHDALYAALNEYAIVDSNMESGFFSEEYIIEIVDFSCQFLEDAFDDEICIEGLSEQVMSEVFEKLFEKRGTQGFYLNPNALEWDVSLISLSSDDIDVLKDIQYSYLNGQTVDQIVNDIEDVNAHELNSESIGSFMSIFYAEYNADPNPTIEGLGSCVADGVGGAIGLLAGGLGGSIIVGACASYLYSTLLPNYI